MKKKLLAMLFTGCMILSLAACGSNGEQEEAKEGTENTEETEQTALGTSSLLTLGEYKGVTYQPMDTTVTDEEVDSEVQYRVAMTKNKESQEVVTETSVVNIDYVGTKDGVAFDGGTQQGQELNIANNNYIEGFADSIVGMKVGETKECPMTFPEDYGVEELNGAAVVFTITVNECWTEIPAELNDEFAVSQGYENLDDMYVAVREEYEAYKKSQAENDMIVQLLKKVVDDSAFNINEEEVDLYVERDMSEQESYAEAYGLDMETYASIYGMTLEEFEASCRENALYNIKAPLVEFKIAELEGLEVTEEKYQTIGAQIMANYGYSDMETFEADYDKSIIEKMVLAQMALELIVENAVAEEVIPSATTAPETTAAGE